jgi:hypothetical protein
MASKITDKLPWFLKEAVAATKGTTQYAAQHGMEGSPQHVNPHQGQSTAR